ncbi:MAG: cyclic nucleotide-binding domain-containing protein [Myxococcota bacterium]|jgi:CRP-like cAMP-binding protein
MIPIVEIEQVLRRSRWLRGMGAGTLSLIAESAEVELFLAGEAVYLAGEEADRLYVVFSGSLSTVIPGIELPVSRLGPGDIAGLQEIPSGTRSTSMVADTDAALLSIGYPRLKALLMQNPRAMLSLLENSLSRIERVEALLYRPQYPDLP